MNTSRASDLAGPRAPELEGERWRIEGQKLWTSMAEEASWIFTLARTEAPAGNSRAREFSMVCVPVPQPGVTICRVELSGMRSAGVCEVFFDDAEAPAEYLISFESIKPRPPGRFAAPSQGQSPVDYARTRLK